MTNRGYSAQVRLASACFYLLVTFFVLLYWRGLWLVADEYIFPADVKKSAYTSLGIGFGGLAVLWIIEAHVVVALPVKGAERRRKCSSRILDCAYLYVASCLSVLSWRGLWLLQDHHLAKFEKVLAAFIAHVLGAASLFVLGYFQSTIACPITIAADSSPVAVKTLQLLQPPNFISRAIPVPGDNEASSAEPTSAGIEMS